MKIYFLLPGLLLAVTLFTACPKPGPVNPAFDLGKPFSLNQGQTKQTADDDLSITFDKVSADSRCPKDVVCIWAGRADCVFTVTKGGATETITLSTGDFSQGGSGQATFNGYTISLNSVDPQKTSTGEIPQKDYVATLTVSK